MDLMNLRCKLELRLSYLIATSYSIFYVIYTYNMIGVEFDITSTDIDSLQNDHQGDTTLNRTWFSTRLA